MTTEMEWLEDAKGNRVSIEYFGSKEAAKKALDSLTDCKNTINCSYCSDCSDCSGCSDCSYCSYCSGCSRCSDCSGKFEKNSTLEKGETIEIPTIQDIDKAVYAAASATPDGLNMGDWHTCETMHCRAGWVVHLAGEPGKALESRFNTELAAMLIYRESGSPISPCRFYDSNEDALADMKLRADRAASLSGEDRSHEGE